MVGMIPNTYASNLRSNDALIIAADTTCKRSSRRFGFIKLRVFKVRTDIKIDVLCIIIIIDGVFCSRRGT